MAEKDFYLYVDGKPVKVSKEIYKEYKRAENKEQYFMGHLKRGHFTIDNQKQRMAYIPSREVSYEQLLEAGLEIAAAAAAEDVMVRNVLMELLEDALHSLTEEERKLILDIFYWERTEREIVAAYHLSQAAVHKRKKHILEKMKKFFS